MNAQQLLFAITSLSLTGTIAPSSYPLVFTTGTSIVIRKTTAEMIVGADSLSAVSTTGAKFSHCKIRQAGNVFFAVAGDIRERFTGFDAEEIATEAARASGAPIDKVKAFERNVMAPLTELVRRTRKSASSYFERRQRNKLVLQVAFFDRARVGLSAREVV